MFTTQMAWHAAVIQRKNVFYATSETTRDMTRRRIYSRHSRLDQFGLVGGLDSKALKQGTLPEGEERVLRAVTEDLAQGTKTGRYGHLYVAQVPPDARLSYVVSAARRVAVQWQIDLIVIDYLALLKPDRRRDSTVQEYADMMKSAKMFATSFDDGKGVPVVSPWAVNQPSYKLARERREYTLANLAETSEAEKSPDILLYLLDDQDEPGKLRSAFLKNRDGAVPPQFMLEVDYRTSYMDHPKAQFHAEQLWEREFGAV
jgi:hypothetical protein